MNSTISTNTYKDYILTMLFSDVSQDHYEGYKTELAEREMEGYLQEPGYA
jgi:hypothetical protein